MAPLDALLRLVLLPGALVAAAAGLGRLLFRRSEPARGALLAAGMAGGLAVALSAIGVRPDLPLAPSDPAWTWVVWIAAGAAVLGASEALRPAFWLAEAVGRAGAGAAAAWLLLEPLVPHGMTPAQRNVGVALAAGLATGLWTVLAAAARRSARVALAGPVLVALTGASVVLLLYGRSAVMAQGAGALVSTAAVAAALRWRSPHALLPVAAAPVVSLVLVSLCTAAYGYLNYGSSVRFPLATGVLLAASAATPVLRRAPLAIAASVALAAAAGWVAAARAVGSPSPW